MKKLNDFLKSIPHKILSGKALIDNVEISGGYISDLLSDVMGSAKENEVWITIMRHLNVVAVASLASIPAVIFSKGIIPEQVVMEKAESEGIILISSELSTYEVSGKLYEFMSE